MEPLNCTPDSAEESSYALHPHIFECEGSQEWIRERSSSAFLLPGDIQFQSVREAMGREEAVFLDLKCRIEHLQEKLRSSQMRFSRLASQVAPIQRLPDELLLKIFSQLSVHTTFTNYQGLLTLVLVCSAWRRLVLGSPSLWTGIALKWGKDCIVGTDTIPDPNPERLAQWLKRSKRALLDLNLHYPFCNRDREFNCDVLSGKLLMECHRWRSLRMKGYDTILSLYQALSHGVPGLQGPGFSELKYLKFTDTYDIAGHNIFTEIQASRLVELRVYSTTITSNSLTSMLSSTPNLETLVIRRGFLGDHQEQANSSSGLKLRLLKHVNWDVQCSDFGQSNPKVLILLSHILASAPGLEKLKIIGNHPGPECSIWSGGHTDWLRSRPRLASVLDLNLKVRIGFLNDLQSDLQTLTEFVSLFPNVETFALRAIWSQSITDDIDHRRSLKLTTIVVSAVKALDMRHLKRVKFCRLPLDQDQLDPLRKLLVESGVDMDEERCKYVHRDWAQDEQFLGEIIHTNTKGYRNGYNRRDGGYVSEYSSDDDADDL
jgi:hypothetical protein